MKTLTLTRDEFTLLIMAEDGKDQLIEMLKDKGFDLTKPYETSEETLGLIVYTQE